MERDVKGLGWFKYEYEPSLKNRPEGAREEDIPDSARWLDTGLHYIIVNGAYQGEGTPEADLAHALHCKKSQEVKLPKLKKRLHDLKETPEGRRVMHQSMDDIFGELLQDNAQEVTLANKAMFATNLLNKGRMPVEEIAECAELPLEEVLKIKAARESEAKR